MPPLTNDTSPPKSTEITRNFGIYFLSNALNRALPFLLLPILSRYLEPEDFGKLALFAATLTFVGPLVHMALYSYISVQFFRKPKSYMATMISSMLPLIGVAAIGIGLLLTLGSQAFGNPIGLPLRYYLLIPLIAFFLNLKAINLTLFRNDNKALSFGLLNIAATLLYLILALYFVVLNGENWEGRANAEILSAVIIGIISILLLKKEDYLTRSIKKKTIAENLSFSIPLIPSLLAISIINISDRFFIEALSGTHELGMYAIGTTFGMMITFLLYSVEQIFVPTIYKKLSDTNSAAKNRLTLVRLTNYYILLIVLLAALLTGVSYLLFDLNFLPQQYLPARRYIGWIAFSYALWGICTILTPYINYSKNTKYLLYAALVGCCINLSANYFLIHQFGAIGAAYAKIITFATMACLYWIYGKRLTPMPWFTKQSWKIERSDFHNFL